jgi:death-on-curing protein
LVHGVATSVVIALHEEQLKEHGGPAGTRDAGLLESALARPRNLLAYGSPDLPALAAGYAFGIAKDHPFTDGNERVSLVVTELFLTLNGHSLEATDEECVLVWRALAAGALSEEQLAVWLRERLRPSG